MNNSSNRIDIEPTYSTLDEWIIKEENELQVAGFIISDTTQLCCGVRRRSLTENGFFGSRFYLAGSRG